MVSVRTLFVVLAAASLGALFMPRIASSEVGGFHVNITPYGGYVDWAKDVNLENRAHFGGALGLMLGRYIGVEGYYGWMKSETRYGQGDSLFLVSSTVSATPTSNQDVQRYGVDAMLNLIPKSALNPYIFGGWHEEKIDNSDTDAVPSQFMNGAEFGGGVKIALGTRTAIRAEIRDQLWKFDSPPAPTENTVHNLIYSGGLQVSLGGSPGGMKDADNDGVSDKKDKCPGTPAGALVDETGCPLDADKDNVPDGLDQCPNTPAGATVDARGCPSDSDNDGVPDGIDKCSGTPAGAQVDATGCPLDSDKDGVPDGIDQCPNTPAGVQVDARGCVSDSDNDGIPDDKDKCPNTQANVKVDADGCPLELTQYEVELLDKGVITVREIHFETAKADILPESRPVLDDIGKILIQWPQLQVEVGGHTDARGSDAYNMDLSQRRAQAVVDYLATNFPQINRANLTAKGYGERQPVASNKTVEGMAKNRRVEFKVLNTEELKKERERRQQLQRGE